MAYKNYITKSGIFFSCAEREYMSTEDTVSEHAVIHICSGSMTITDATKTYTANEGDTFMLNRHLLAKFTKHPSGTEQFKSIAILFSQPFLQKFYSTSNISSDTKHTGEVMRFSRHPLIRSLFDSILPYFELNENGFPSHLMEIKLQEAMTILRAVDLGVDSFLANFAEPGKIDLADFIMKNFHFNIPIQRFAYLSGRSLATFKRDFQKTFHEPPQKWLLQKRLRQAHYLMAEKLQKPSDVYLEVGFENLSHFSTSFRQQFGYSPSSLLVSR